ncbi:response regulator [Nocardioides marmotae]|uniref:response regulator n=1 Tax=Nocardioides marmotae TaxID=2663857 RepID=UPI0012B521E4|nr:response regulator [Nocardioides marmotae]QKE02904.1 response regulator [Nocardioides marmotae]
MTVGERPPEHLLRFVIETTPDGLCFVGASGTITFANDAVATAVGRTAAELVGRPLSDLFVVPPGEAAPAAAGAVENLETLLAHADGTAVPALASALPLPTDLGERWRRLVRVTPYAGSRERFEEWRQDEHALADAHEIARIGSWTWDTRSDVAEWSQEMFHIVGRDPATWVPSLTSFLGLVHPDDRESVATALGAVVEGRGAFTFDARIVRPDGTERWMRGLGHPDETPSGGRLLRGTAQDVTDVREADAELAHAGRRLRLMQEVAYAANQASTLVEAVDVAARAMSIHTRGWEPLGVHVPDGDRLEPFASYDGPVPLDAPEVVALAERARADGEIAAGAAPGPTPAAGIVAVPVTTRGRVACVLVMYAADGPPDDSTRALLGQAAIQLGVVAEREQHAAELAEARDEAMRASRLKSEFLATMSHEIRTPMNGVIGLTELLDRTGLDDQQRRLVVGLRDAGQTLMAIINDILDLSKIEAGKLELETADFDPRAVLHQTAGVLAAPAHDKGLELVVACAPDLPPVLRGDAVRWGQVVSNLTSNAVKFTDRGEVVVTAETVTETPTAVVLRVTVRDTGVGIAPEGRARLFDAFTQADPSTTRRHGGTGLGLAISRQLVHALGGEITVESEPGVGSTFTFTARLARGAAPAGTTGGGATKAGATDAGAVLAGRRVLVVDDNTTNRRVLTEQLCAWGLDVVAVCSADEARLALRTSTREGQAYDVAVVDLLMPGEDGLDLARRLRADSTVRQPRLVLLSSDQAVGAGDARAAGFEATVAKPVRHDELRELLASLLGPAANRDAQRPAEPVAPADELGLRVLVVEDNPVNQLVATGILESRGYAVDVASDGVEALERLRGDHGFAAVLMDCRMPRLDGFGTTRAYRRGEPEGRRTPIIAMTASALEGERERCLASGMDDFLTKPVDPGDLDAVLRRWTGPQATGCVGADGSGDRAGDGAGDRAGDRAGDEAGRSRPTGPVLDPSRVRMLDELRKDGVSFFVRTAGSFTGRIDEQVAAIREAVRSGDANRTFTATHLVKGSALNLGLTRVAEVGQRMEDHAERGSTAGMTGLLEDLDREVAAALAALRDAVGR